MTESNTLVDRSLESDVCAYTSALYNWQMLREFGICINAIESWG